jgi:predicted phosphodiesterase
MFDTHLPTRAKRLPEALIAATDKVDVALHGGDWTDEAALRVATKGPAYRRTFPHRTAPAVLNGTDADEHTIREVMAGQQHLRGESAPGTQPPPDSTALQGNS